MESRAAEKLRAEWGCGGGKPTASKRLRQIAEAYAEVVGCDTPEGCPFEGACRPQGNGGWTAEILDALLLRQEAKVDWVDALGRELTAADREAILAVERTRAKLTRLEMPKPKKDGGP